MPPARTDKDSGMSSSAHSGKTGADQQQLLIAKLKEAVERLEAENRELRCANGDDMRRARLELEDAYRRKVGRTRC